MANTLSDMVIQILTLRSELPPVPDELRKRVQSIRVRSAQETQPSWRQKSASGHSGNGHSGNGHSGNSHAGNSHTGNSHSGNNNKNSWRHTPTQSSGSTPPFRFSNSSIKPAQHAPSFIAAASSAQLQSPLQPQQPLQQQPQVKAAPPAISVSSAPMRYISKFHNGDKTGDDKILNTIILNKLNIFSAKTYDDVKLFLFQILGSDEKEFIREFTWLVFRKAAAEEKYCALFARLLADIKREYPVILEEMRNLYTTYLDIWNTKGATDTTVDRRCRLGYSQFLAELTALGALESDALKLTMKTLMECIDECISEAEHIETIEEYMFSFSNL